MVVRERETKTGSCADSTTTDGAHRDGPAQVQALQHAQLHVQPDADVRSADEPMDDYFRLCNNCGHRWKFINLLTTTTH